MKVIGIVGSFRKQGNTDIIVEQALNGARAAGADVEKVFVDDLEVASCQGCMDCRKEGICKLEDDMMKLVKKIDAADGVIVSSPIYGNYITGQLKVLLDRMMGVINRVTYVPGEGRKTFTRLEPKRRNILIVLTAGAPDDTCAEDSLKLIRRMFGSFTNGGTMAELIATNITAQGEIIHGMEELTKKARMYGSKTPEETAKAAKARNEEVLARAFAEGKNLILASENN